MLQGEEVNWSADIHAKVCAWRCMVWCGMVWRGVVWWIRLVWGWGRACYAAARCASGEAR